MNRPGVAAGRVVVAVSDETLELRLRLLVEAEGGEVTSLSDAATGEGRTVLILVSSDRSRRICQALPGIAVYVVDAADDWDAVRNCIAEALASQDDTLSEAGALARALAQARVLLVDDSVTYREFLRLELTRMGAEVVVCGAADEAMRLLGHRQWDCVLVDLVMPGVDGAALCGQAAQLRRRHGRKYLLGVLSSREGKADLLRSLEAGADVFLGKSQDMTIFRARLGAMLRHRLLNSDEPPVW
jgi:CheY-like chemotaxis protein